MTRIEMGPEISPPTARDKELRRRGDPAFVNGQNKTDNAHRNYRYAHGIARHRSTQETHAIYYKGQKLVPA